ncbi:hypothetical protein J2Y58_001829 [Sphingomonas sp. BE138]|uniref:DUF1996 domain-containing protein n=1 Tax=Sphingomonas sp. BE138 TaxID=2817845 RepID=UPI002863DD1C|nr:DUF1996 domain-containing protein [Sphingomonas sp. BE138]MDR6788471.1 hypothetical protein [Sphingomonas sp. BE138]
MTSLLRYAAPGTLSRRTGRTLTQLAGALALASCGGGSGGGGAAAPTAATPVAIAPAASPTPAPAPAPTPTPAPSPVSAGSLSAATDYSQVASNFDMNAELVPSWGTGEIPASAAPDTDGAFRFICNPSHELRDDPVVFPGQPGKSHLHQFFGNTLANGNSTYQSLRTSGASTCNSPLNRSAYWMPAMLNGKGGVVRPDFISIYYKRRPQNDPECQRMGKACVDLPRGLRFVFGYDMLNGTPKTGAGYYNCQGPTAKSGHYVDIVEAAKNCTVGNQLGAVISAPNCWDGKNLDSADHRAHVAYTSYGDWGYPRCPDTHPYVIPTFTMGVWYTVDADLDTSGSWDRSTSTWHLASDEMPGMPMMRPGSTFHADWFGAWDDTVMRMWTDHCINKLLNCSGGDLGNGKQLKMFAGFSWTAKPHVVPVPN